MIITWVMMLILSNDPYVTAGFIAKFKTKSDCFDMMKIAPVPEEDRANLRCVALAEDGI